MSKRVNKNVMIWLLSIPILVSCLFTLAGTVGTGFWLLDLTRHFPLQYLCVQIVGLVLLLKFKPRAYLAFGFAILILMSCNMFKVYAYYWPTDDGFISSKQSKNAVQRLKILQMNVLVINQNYQAVSQLLKSTDADIVSLQEAGDKWYKALEEEGGLNHFPYRIMHLKSGNILISRIPFKRWQIIPLSESGNQQKVTNSILFADISLAGKTVSLIALHPHIPLSPLYEAQYLKHFQELEAHKLMFSTYRILIGDLNTTPWSSHYSRFLRLMDLKDARAHQGFYPTWNTFFPLFCIPIDHILVTKHFLPIHQKIGPFITSDHLPVYMELGLIK